MTPDELEAAIERHGLQVIEETGVIYNLIADRWQISTDMDVNYMVTAEKARASCRLAGHPRLLGPDVMAGQARP